MLEDNKLFIHNNPQKTIKRSHFVTAPDPA
jgi:hypothetical protein